MKLELRKSAAGLGFSICVCGEVTGRQIVIPLSQDLSLSIDLMLMAEGIKTNSLILPPAPTR